MARGSKIYIYVSLLTKKKRGEIKTWEFNIVLCSILFNSLSIKPFSLGRKVQAVLWKDEETPVKWEGEREREGEIGKEEREREKKHSWAPALRRVFKNQRTHLLIRPH